MGRLKEAYSMDKKRARASSLVSEIDLESVMFDQCAPHYRLTSSFGPHHLGVEMQGKLTRHASSPIFDHVNPQCSRSEMMKTTCEMPNLLKYRYVNLGVKDSGRIHRHFKDLWASGL